MTTRDLNDAEAADSQAGARDFVEPLVIQATMDQPICHAAQNNRVSLIDVSADTAHGENVEYGGHNVTGGGGDEASSGPLPYAAVCEHRRY